jgi:hypothetical protein
MLTPGVRLLLETGRCGEPNQGAEHEDWVMLFRAHKPGSRAAEPLWRDHGEEILAEWVAEHPGTRPWGWWKFDATEPRPVVRGTALVSDRRWWAERWRDQFGVPMFVQIRPRGAALPLVESEASYLQRLGLFAVGERAECDEEAFEPEEINPFSITEKELDQSPRGGPPR